MKKSVACHDEPTFPGPRILVADGLEQIATGIAWDTIVEEYLREPRAQSKLAITACNY